MLLTRHVADIYSIELFTIFFLVQIETHRYIRFLMLTSTDGIDGRKSMDVATITLTLIL